ncbi:hypothetical protein [Dokdonella sp.]|uniref:hypothetical protein n=1 Tax=Dokdonella sp. TaxID=2291710 RepID=UPI003528E643
MPHFLFDLFEAGNLDRTEAKTPAFRHWSNAAPAYPGLIKSPSCMRKWLLSLRVSTSPLAATSAPRRLLEEAIASAERTTDEKLHAQVELAQANLANATGDSTRAGMLYERAENA